MRLEEIRIPTNQDIFEENLKDFVKYKWPNMIMSVKVKDVFRRRYEVSYPVDSVYAIGHQSRVFGEIETISLEENRTEIRVAAIYDEERTFHSNFFDSLYSTIHKKWLPEEIPKPEMTNMGEIRFPNMRTERPIAYKIKHLKARFGFSYDANMGKELKDPKQEAGRQMILIELHRKLPPIEESEDLNSTRSQPESKKGMSEWRERRAYLFKEVKDKNPRLTYDQVAAEATDMVHNEIEEQIRKTNPGMDNEKLEYMVLEKFKNEYNNGRKEFSGDDVDNDFDVKEWTWIDSRKFDE